MKRAVVLLSGGLDSATALAICRADGFESYALSFRYGQRHERELAAARKIAKSLGAKEHRIARIDLRVFAGSALTAELEVPKTRSATEMASGIPVTYVPARNTIFLSYALAWAEVLGATDIFIGANAIDYSGYPDCRPEFIRAFEQLANLATRAGVEGARFAIHAPLLALSKAAIIQRGLSLGVDYALTHSCYDPTSDGTGLRCLRFVPTALERLSRSGADRPDRLRAMNLRSRLGMFVLTRQEQRTIAFIVLAVILGLITQHYRRQHSERLDAVPNNLEQAGPAFVSPAPTPQPNRGYR